MRLLLAIHWSHDPGRAGIGTARKEGLHSSRFYDNYMEARRGIGHAIYKRKQSRRFPVAYE
jgi:hypothetical protein